MTDASIHQHITDLVHEERALRDKLATGQISQGEEHSRLQQLETELDQAWDLLRQRDAKREFGENPDTAEVRSAGTVEGYLG